MYCVQCGQKQTSEALFCQFCGTKLPIPSAQVPAPTPQVQSQPFHPPAPPRPAGSRGTGFAIAGLILGILGIINALLNFGMLAAGSFFYVPWESVVLVFLVSTVATVFSGIAVAKGSGAGIAGLILGSLGVSFSILLVSAFTI
jgi:hypothetical protein